VVEAKKIIWSLCGHDKAQNH